MAKAPKAAAGSIMKWDEELAKQAEAAAATEANSGGGQFFSVKGGILQWNEAPLPGNQMGVVILDSIFENVYYEEDYDPDNVSSPSCFAFGRDEKEMKPHQVVVEAGTAQKGPCTGCPLNEWGSSDKGRGKACRNVRRLALIPAGTFNQAGKFEAIDDVEHFESTAVGFMKLPVTSVKGYASFVKQVAGALKRPPQGIITKVKVVQDPKSQFKVTFEPIVALSNELLPAIFKRRDEVKTTIDFPYQPRDPEAEAPRGKKGGRQARKY